MVQPSSADTQQLAFLGVGNICVVDLDKPDITSLNRVIGARYNDHLSGLFKVDIAERLVKEVDPTIGITKVNLNVISSDGFDAVKQADFVFGCVDHDGPRAVLTELSAAYELPYLDLASEILLDDTPHYGGRLCFAHDGNGCLFCLDLMSSREIAEFFMSEGVRAGVRQAYGLPAEENLLSGPSVVTLNGVVASLATTEFMVHVTGIRPAKRSINYHSERGIVTVGKNEPRNDCFYCKSVYGKRLAANVERYLA